MRPAQRWLEDEGIVYVGFWEPIHFYRQLGNATQNQASRLDYIKSETHLKKLASIGVNHLWTHFSKGYGLDFEHAEQLKVKAMCKIAKKLGMRVIAYCTGGSLTPETVRYEAPDVDDWISHPTPGTWASYGNGAYQNFRARPCYTSPGYMRWQKKVIDRALDYGCDGIHFDNTNVNAEPEGCHCPRCLKLFVKFLAEKYDRRDPEKRRAGIERWGRDRFDYARDPWWNQWNQPVFQRELSVANQQDWALFRQKAFQDCLLEWARHIHKRGAAVEYNTGKGVGSAYRWWGAINDEMLYPETDIVFNEGALKLGYNKHGSPHCRLREHKIVQNFDLPMMNYNHSTHMMVEAFSFNPGMVGMWGSKDNPAEHAEKIAFFQWYRKHRHYQTRQVSLAETAVLFHHESMTFSTLRVYLESNCVTQQLQEECRPYNIVYVKDLDSLDRYRLLVIPGMHCLKEAEAEKILAWVRRGGRLLTTGSTGARDDYFRKRTRIKEVRNEADLYAADEPENLFTPVTGENYQRAFCKPLGKGYIAHLPKLEYVESPDESSAATWMVESACINRPKNSAELSQLLKRLLPDPNLVVKSKQDLAVDLCRRTDTGEGLVHLFNISYSRQKAATADVAFRFPDTVRSLTWIAFNRPDTAVPFRRVLGEVRFKLRGIPDGAVIVINRQEVRQTDRRPGKGVRR